MKNIKVWNNLLSIMHPKHRSVGSFNFSHNPMLKPTLLILSTTLILTGCGPTDINTLEKQSLTFDALPDTVKAIYQKKAQKDRKYNAVFEYSVVSTDSSIDFKHEHTGAGDGIVTLLTRGFNHHFYINGQHFKLGANQGNPFILHGKHLYYTLELNLADYNYRSAEYISVDLGGHLK